MLIEIIIFILAVVGIYYLYSAYAGNAGLLFGGPNGKGFSGKDSNAVQELFFKTVFTLLGYVARQDGPVNKKEISRTETFMAKMNLDASQKREAIRLFKSGSAPQFDVQDTIKQFKGLARKSPNLTQILLVYLINLARVDGLLVRQEIGAVQEVASGLGYSDITFEHLLKMVSSQDKFGADTFNEQAVNEGKTRQGNTYEHEGAYQSRSKNNKDGAHQKQKKYNGFNSESDRSNCAYDALGLTPRASDAEVKKAYRSLANQFHPDKLIGQGLPPFMVTALTERFKNIQTAYDCIKEFRTHH